ncbi:MAG: DALR anticodon-binding domain-containing protein, partial [Raoultibacter sp.]
LLEKLLADGADLSLRTHESEIALRRKMSEFGELVSDAARDRAAFRLTHYAQDLAALFHQFYTNCHVLGEDKELEKARLNLANGTRIVLARALDLLGVSAPAQM